MEYHALADAGSARYTPNCDAGENVMAWWKKPGEQMRVYFDDRIYPRCPFAAVRSYLDKALEHFGSGVVGTVCDIVKHFRIHAILRKCAALDLWPYDQKKRNKFARSRNNAQFGEISRSCKRRSRRRAYRVLGTRTLDGLRTTTGTYPTILWFWWFCSIARRTTTGRVVPASNERLTGDELLP